jgi:phosphatidylglycerophosphatase A
LGDLRHTAAVLAVQFFLFRLFDVVKPPPARQLERLPAGWGILLDDLAAGIYANIVGQVVFRYCFSWS